MPIKARLKQLLIAVHLYLGLALCVFFALWFVSGIAMLYYNTPILTPRMRQAAAGAFPWASVRLDLPEAGRKAGWPDEALKEVRLGSFLGRPVLRALPLKGDWRAVFLDDGKAVAFSEAQAREAARAGFGGDWELQGKLSDADWGQHNALRPYRSAYRLSDGHRELQIAESTGDPVLLKREGFEILFWLGPVLHYFNQQVIRDRPLLWNSLVNWSSFLGGIMCLVGVVLGVWVLRWKRVGDGSGQAVPYRDGWMWYHHVLGLFFGGITFTWVVSGLFSMNPLKIFPSSSMEASETVAFSGGELRLKDLEGLKGIASKGLATREVAVTRFGSTLRFKLWREQGAYEVWQHGAKGWEHAPLLDAPTLASAVERAFPGSQLQGSELLEKGDSYYYERPQKDRFKSFPVYRLQVDGAKALSLYVEPRSGEVFLKHSAGSKFRRWAYNGLHSFDFGPMASRPFWDLFMWIFSLCGLALSVTGIVISWRWFAKRLSKEPR